MPMPFLGRTDAGRRMQSCVKPGAIRGAGVNTVRRPSVVPTRCRTTPDKTRRPAPTPRTALH